MSAFIIKDKLLNLILSTLRCKHNAILASLGWQTVYSTFGNIIRTHALSDGGGGKL